MKRNNYQITHLSIKIDNFIYSLTMLELGSEMAKYIKE
mgnify:CR=1 FL=1